MRTLVETELAARDASNVVNRLTAAAFPVPKTLESFDVVASSIPRRSSTTWPVWNGLGLNRIWPSSAQRAPARALIALGSVAIQAGHKVRYFTAADLIETLYRGLADNTVGKIIESLLRVDLMLLFRLVAGADERRSLAIGSHWPFEQWGRFLPQLPARLGRRRTLGAWVGNTRGGVSGWRPGIGDNCVCLMISVMRGCSR